MYTVISGSEPSSPHMRVGRPRTESIHRKAVEMEKRMSAVPNPWAWREPTIARIEHHLRRDPNFRF